MIEQSTHCHHRYNYSEDSFTHTKQDGIELSITKAPIKKWTVYLHVDYPFDPMEVRDTSALESRTQLYFQLIDDL